MKILNCEDLVEMPLNPGCINSKNAIDGNGIMLPYENREFKMVIRHLFDDVVKESGSSWTIPDYEKSKAFFYIINNEIYLSIEVLPKRFSANEKQSMLKAASQEEMNDGWSEDLRLMNMFDDIDDILNCSYPVGEVGIYELELTEDERKEVFSILK